MSMSATTRRPRGFTLVEMLIVVALGALLLALVGPSFRSMIDRQRVNSTNSQLVTDLQFARSEAVSRNALVRVTFKWNTAQTCYTIYTYNPALPGSDTQCDCLQATPCTAAGSVELRTARVPLDTGVNVRPGTSTTEFAFEPVTGALYKIPTDFFTPPLNQFVAVTYIDLARSLRTTLGLSGRPTVCAPVGSKMQAAAC